MTIDAALNLVTLDYRVQKRRSLNDVAIRLAHLRRLLPCGTALPDLDRTMLLAYAVAREDEHVQGATINREIAMLRRAYTLANVPWPIPAWQKLPENEPRQGRIDGDLFARILSHMAPKYAAVCWFLYYTGWRVNAALGLPWDAVDLRANTIRLPARLAKNKRAQTIPMIPQLRALVEAQIDGVKSEYVFHHEGPTEQRGRPTEGGSRIAYTGFYHIWCKAREKAGAPNAIPHDFRRTAITKMVKEAKLDRRTAMRFSGHATESAFVRYEIEDDEVLRDGAEKLGRVMK